MYKQGQKIPQSKFPLDCDICKEFEYYPNIKYCFNCEKDNSNCEVWHDCGKDCPEWKGEEKIDRTPTELEDTVDMMLSSSYEERFEAEYYQVKIRRELLKKMLQQWEKGVTFMPKSQKQVFDNQLASMTNYLISLELRAQYEGIALNTEEV